MTKKVVNKLTKKVVNKKCPKKEEKPVKKNEFIEKLDNPSIFTLTCNINHVNISYTIKYKDEYKDLYKKDGNIFQYIPDNLSYFDCNIIPVSNQERHGP